MHQLGWEMHVELCDAKRKAMSHFLHGIGFGKDILVSFIAPSLLD
jgi:hypothetical protein